MLRFALALCLLLAGPSDGATLSSVVAKRDHLLPYLNYLADALRQDLMQSGIKEEVAEGMKKKMEEQAARKRLEMEANRLESEGGRGSKLAATVVRNLARHGTLADIEQSSSPAVSQSSVSESTVVSDGKGHSRMLRKVRKCKNGVCEELTESSKPDDSADHTKSLALEHTNESTLKKAGNSTAQETPADDEIFRAVNAFRDLDDSMDFNVDFVPPDIFGLNDDFWNRFRAPAPALPVNGNTKGAIFKGSEPASNEEEVSEAFQNAESVSSQTIMRNGKVVRQTTRCKNGKCETIVEEGSLGRDSQPEAQQQQEQHVPAISEPETVLQKEPVW